VCFDPRYAKKKLSFPTPWYKKYCKAEFEPNILSPTPRCAAQCEIQVKNVPAGYAAQRHIAQSFDWHSSESYVFTNISTNFVGISPMQSMDFQKFD
jgi:hypothetical protein